MIHSTAPRPDLEPLIEPPLVIDHFTPFQLLGQYTSPQLRLSLSSTYYTIEVVGTSLVALSRPPWPWLKKRGNRKQVRCSRQKMGLIWIDGPVGFLQKKCSS